MIIGQAISVGGGTSSSEVTAAKALVLGGYRTITSDSLDEIVEGTMPSLPAQVWTPTTSNLTILSGRYLSGDLTIAGDTNLIASNIKKGVTMFGVTGTFEGYVPQTGDIYYNGVWGSGWSASNVMTVGTAATYSFPPQIAYDSLFIIAKGNRYVSGAFTLYGFFEFNKQIHFQPNQRFEIEIYNPNQYAFSVMLFMTPQLYSYGTGDYQVASGGSKLLINSIEVLADGYSTASSASIGAYSTGTVSVISNLEYNGYLGICPIINNANPLNYPLHIKKMSLS